MGLHLQTIFCQLCDRYTWLFLIGICIQAIFSSKIFFPNRNATIIWVSNGCFIHTKVLTLKNDGFIDLEEIFEQCVICIRSLLGRTGSVILFPTMRFICHDSDAFYWFPSIIRNNVFDLHWDICGSLIFSYSNVSDNNKGNSNNYCILTVLQALCQAHFYLSLF